MRNTVRDNRRAKQLVGGTNKKHDVAHKIVATAPDPELEVGLLSTRNTYIKMTVREREGGGRRQLVNSALVLV